MLVLIGANWLHRMGDRRKLLENPTDVLRLEIEHALAMQIRVLYHPRR